MLGRKIVGDLQRFAFICSAKNLDICLSVLNIRVSLRLKMTRLDWRNNVHMYFIYFGL